MSSSGLSFLKRFEFGLERLNLNRGGFRLGSNQFQNWFGQTGLGISLVQVWKLPNHLRLDPFVLDKAKLVKLKPNPCRFEGPTLCLPCLCPPRRYPPLQDLIIHDLGPRHWMIMIIAWFSVCMFIYLFRLRV